MGGVRQWFASWRLISWRSAVVLAVVLYALIGLFVVPWIAERVIEKVGREKLGAEITIESVSCNPFTLSLTVNGLSLPDRSGDEMLSFDRLYGNLQSSSLFRWAFTLKQVRIESPFVGLRRFEDGGINIVELKEAIDLHWDLSDEAFGLPRAILREILITSGQVELEDRARPEPLVWNGGPAELRLYDISTIPEEEGSNDISLGLPEGGTIRISGDVVVEPFGLDGTVSIDKFVLGNSWAAVGHKFDFVVEGGELATGLGYRIALDDDGLQLDLENLEAQVQGLGVRTLETGGELLQLASVDLTGGSLRWPEAELEVDAVAVDGADASLWIEPDGTPVWTTLVPEQTRQELLDLWETLNEEHSPVAVVHSLEIRGAGAAFEDRTFAEPVRVEVAEAAVTVTEMSSEPDSSWGLDASARVDGEAQGTAQGTVTASPLTVETEVGIDGLDLSRFQPYVARFLPVDLKAGSLTASGTARLARSDEAPDVTFEGRVLVGGLELVETVTDSPLLQWGELEVDGVKAALAPTSVEIAQVDIHRAGLKIAVAEDGTINVLEFIKAISDDLENLPPAQVARIELHDCFGTYSEETPQGPFELGIESVNGSIASLVTDSSDTAELEIDATIETGGTARVTGKLDPFDYAQSTELEVAVREVLLPPMSAKSIAIIGHPLDQGRATLDLDVEITDRQLVSANHFEIDQLKLGERVEGDRVIDLPIKLGVSLLKDKNGTITLDIPVEGDLSDPDFVMKAALRSAFTEIVGEVAKSPFRALGKLIGGSDEQNLEFVDFPAGSAVLEARVTSNLDTLAQALEERPSLGLGIPGVVDPVADKLALREQALAEELAGEGEATADLDKEVPLDRLETRLGPPAEVEALRAQHTSGTEEPVLDEGAYRRALLDTILATQEFDETRYQALAAARAEAIRSYLVDTSGVDSSRIELLPDPVTASEGVAPVRCQLVLVGTS